MVPHDIDPMTYKPQVRQVSSSDTDGLYSMADFKEDMRKGASLG
jgi:hypothetical protein